MDTGRHTQRTSESKMNLCHANSHRMLLLHDDADDVDGKEKDAKTDRQRKSETHCK